MENDNLTLEFTVAEINLILAGLSEMPFKQVADLFNKIHLQSNAAMAAKLQEQAPRIEVVEHDDKNDKADTTKSSTGNK
jgi:hypothetical protein